MIKKLSKIDIHVTPFVAAKDWSFSNLINDALLLLEQTGSDGGDVALAWEKIEFGDGSAPYTSSEGSIALEQQVSDQVIYQEGIKKEGLFYPSQEEVNKNGTYKRLVYTLIYNMFYNDYKDPTKVWGLEKIDIHKNNTIKFLKEKIRSFVVYQSNFGEKILENSVKLIDNSLDNDYLIVDDGFGNLFAERNLFSRVQEVEYFSGYIETDSFRVTETSQYRITEDNRFRILERDADRWRSICDDYIPKPTTAPPE